MRGAVTPLPHYVFIAWCLVKHRDFTLTFTLPYKCYIFHHRGRGDDKPSTSAMGVMQTRVHVQSSSTQPGRNWGGGGCENRTSKWPESSNFCRISDFLFFPISSVHRI
jgi:hypothetical protein